jgi:hypothetical protein
MDAESNPQVTTPKGSAELPGDGHRCVGTGRHTLRHAFGTVMSYTNTVIALADTVASVPRLVTGRYKQLQPYSTRDPCCSD